MPEEIGVVIEKTQGGARVRLQRQSRCAGCNACLMGEGGGVVAEAYDPLGVSVGDRVKIDVAAGSSVRSGFLLYILPLLLFVPGYFAAGALARFLGQASELWGALGGFAAMALTYLAIHLIDKRARAGRPPDIRVVRVLERGAAADGYRSQSQADA